MRHSIRVAVDVMGGDYGIPVTLSGCVLALKKYANLEIILYGPAKKLALELSKHSSSIQNRTVICNTTESITMSDTIAQARAKPNSSMQTALESVVSGRSDAFVTAGNTSVLTYLCKQLVPVCDGVTSTAFISEIPTVGRPTYMLDLGANLEAQTKTLVEYAFLGHFCAEVFSRQKYPKVALLNVGKEDNKGTLQVRRAHQYLKRTSLNYHGFIEGHELFNNDVDVIICDGKTGNIVLKASEGAANLISSSIKDALLSSMATTAMAMPVLFKLRTIKKDLDPNRYNGSILAGYTKIISKSHGASNAKGFAHAIGLCVDTNPYDLAQRIEEGFQRHDLQDLDGKLNKKIIE